MERITLVAVFYNEETKLPGYFRNVEEVVDKKIVVDCSSTDATVKICGRNGARVIRSNHRYFEQNVNRALDRVEGGGWVLILDADERLSPELKREIRRATEKPSADIYFMKRINYLFDGFSTKSTINTYLPRLFRKGCVRWEQEMPHEKPVLEGKQARLKSLFFHYAYPSIPSYLHKMEDYLCQMPLQFSKNGKMAIRISERDSRGRMVFGTHGWRRMFLFPIFIVLNHLLRHRLILDGRRGIVFAVCAGSYAFFEEAVWWGAHSNRKMKWRNEYPVK